MKKSISKIGFSLILILGVLILYPAIRTLMVSFQSDLGVSFVNYEYIFNNTGSLTAAKNTLILGFLTVITCGITGTFLALLVHYYKGPFSRILDKIFLLPLVIPGLIIVFAFLQLYGESGLVTKSLEYIFNLEKPIYSFIGLGGILLVHTYTQYVYFYMNVSVALKQMDYSLIEAAENLGASEGRIFTTVIFPFIKPAVVSSAILTFMTGIGSFSAPIIIGGNFRVLTTEILLSKANMYLNLAAAQVVVLTIIAFTWLALGRYYEKKVSFAHTLKAVEFKGKEIKNKFYKVLINFIYIFTIIMIFLPVFTIIFLSFVKSGTWMIEIFPKEFSFENYIKIFTNSRSFAPFVNSLKMSLLAGGLAILIGIPSGYIISKTKGLSKGMVELMVMLPFAMPASAIAINMINGFSNTLLGSWIFLPLAYFISSLPLAVRSISLSFSRMKNEYREASENLGASSFQTIKRVIIPLIAPGIWSGFLLVFIRSMGEYTLSAFLYTPSNRPVSIAMVNSMFEFDIGMAMSYGSLVLILTFLSAIFITKFQLLQKGSGD